MEGYVLFNLGWLKLCIGMFGIIILLIGFFIALSRLFALKEPTIEKPLLILKLLILSLLVGYISYTLPDSLKLSVEYIEFTQSNIFNV